MFPWKLTGLLSVHFALLDHDRQRPSSGANHLEGCGGMNLCRSNTMCQGWQSRSHKDSCPEVES